MNWDSTKPIAANQSCQKNSFQPIPYIVEIFACASWNKWKARSGHIFHDQQPSLARWKVKFKSDQGLRQPHVKHAMVQSLM